MSHGVDSSGSDAPVDDGESAPAAASRVADADTAGAFDALTRRLPGSPATGGVLLVTALALVVRVVGLGGRVFHWDEGRVAYWILRFDVTGEFFYRPIIHGPFLPVVNNVLFDLVGASDFAARLPVAVVGALLPLAALCFRHRLRGREQVALALVLAADPLLIYYARFMRGDVLVGSFCVAAFALTVYAVDTRDVRPVFPAVVLLALGFTAKENALVYVLCFAGAAFLLFDHRLVRTASRTGSLLDALVGAAIGGVRWLDDWTAGSRTRGAVERFVADRTDGDATPPSASPVGLVVHLAVWVPLGAVGVAATFLAVTTFFYAPRPELWQALGGLVGAGPTPPTASAGSVLEEATIGAAEKFYGTWASGTHSDHPYLPYLGDIAETIAYGSGVTAALAAIGFLSDSYGSGRNRALVAFAAYWAAASVVGYPVATDIQAPWAAVHVTLPLAVPAAVGLVAVVDSFESSLRADDAVGVGLAALVVFAAVGGVVGPNVDYWNSASVEDKAVLQWAQPENDLKGAMADVGAVARNNDGTDVLFVGTKSGGNTLFYVANESSTSRMPAGGPSWHSRLPLPWYLELHGATVNSTAPEARFDGLPEDPPPVVIAKPWDRDELEVRLDGYQAREYKFRLWSEHVVVFIDRSALDAATQPQASTESREATDSRASKLQAPTALRASTDVQATDSGLPVDLQPNRGARLRPAP
ncbi:flippase activity-associated protein Agl23 [Halobaculum sp. D14]|uniref:flippase activity-associated protein Agl23 n=1 Tax=Halobaculum sp. D14 TaxID=3421642 RepID=UPI003EBDB2B8